MPPEVAENTLDPTLAYAIVIATIVIFFVLFAGMCAIAVYVELHPETKEQRQQRVRKEIEEDKRNRKKADNPAGLIVVVGILAIFLFLGVGAFTQGGKGIDTTLGAGTVEVSDTVTDQTDP